MYELKFSILRAGSAGIAIMRPYLYNLNSHPRDIAEVGGKAHNLMSLIALGMPVPAGFIVTPEAFRALDGSNGIPAAMEREIAAAYFNLGAGPVTVRSSVTSEDPDTASFPRHQETTRKVHGLPALLDAIRSAWASLFSARAAAYRQHAGHDITLPAMALVVQKMIDAQTAGVLFTVDPLSGDRSRLVIDACRGLGDGVVSGEISPDHYQVDRSVPDIVRRPAGCLTSAQIAALAKAALRIEAAFGSPQAIEWAIDEDGIHILQARPITTSQSEPSPKVEWTSSVSGASWVRRGGGLTEYLPGPVSPLYATSQLRLISDLHDVDEDDMGITPSRPSCALINGHIYTRQDYKLGLRAFLLPFRYWQAAQCGVRQWLNWLPDHLRQLDRLTSVRLEKLSTTALLEHVASLIQLNSVAWDMTVRASRAWLFTEPLFRRIYRWIRPITKVDPTVFLRGFESRTLEAEAALCELVRGALIDPEINCSVLLDSAAQTLDRLSHTPGGRYWLEEFQAYSRKYGHLIDNHDYLYPAPADDPAKVLSSIRTRMNLIQEDPLARQKQLAARRCQATTQSFEKLASFPLRKAIFRWILSWTQEGASVREDVYFNALRGWPAARRAILALGQRFVEAGTLQHAGDIFFLTWPEAKRIVLSAEAGDWTETVESRRAEHRQQSRLSPPPSVPLSGPPLTIARHVKNLLKRDQLAALASQ